MAHGADMVVESRNMSDDVLFTPELIVLMPRCRRPFVD